MGLDFEAISERLVRLETKMDTLINTVQQMTLNQSIADSAVDDVKIRVVKLEAQAAIAKWAGGILVLYVILPLIRKVIGI